MTWLNDLISWTHLSFLEWTAAGPTRSRAGLGRNLHMFCPRHSLKRDTASLNDFSFEPSPDACVKSVNGRELMLTNHTGTIQIHTNQIQIPKKSQKSYESYVTVITVNNQLHIIHLFTYVLWLGTHYRGLWCRLLQLQTHSSLETQKTHLFFELLRGFFQRFFHVEICFFPRNWLSGRHSRSDQYLWGRWSLASWSVWKRNCERGRCFPCFPESFSLYCCCSNFNELWYTWPVDWVLVANERNRAGTFGCNPSQWECIHTSRWCLVA